MLRKLLWVIMYRCVDNFGNKKWCSITKDEVQEAVELMKTRKVPSLEYESAACLNRAGITSIKWFVSRDAPDIQ